MSCKKTFKSFLPVYKESTLTFWVDLQVAPLCFCYKCASNFSSDAWILNSLHQAHCTVYLPSINVISYCLKYNKYKHTSSKRRWALLAQCLCIALCLEEINTLQGKHLWEDTFSLFRLPRHLPICQNQNLTKIVKFKTIDKINI